MKDAVREAQRQEVYELLKKEFLKTNQQPVTMKTDPEFDRPDAPQAGDSLEQPERPIWEIVEEIGSAIAEEEWDKLPTDASSNLDHYLYRIQPEQ